MIRRIQLVFIPPRGVRDMTKQEILAACAAYGAARDVTGFSYFADQHRMVVQDPKAKRNSGKVAVIDLLRAYSQGSRINR